ncbi:lasso peptide biosynthesis B2 protein [Asticcacaulis sp.]|uniref:lasso peptide biosynthesis B2 protein n=1 Tax=Asticcacaulis sp. TaxID=1872648 RepID=UPI00391D94E0
MSYTTPSFLHHCVVGERLVCLDLRSDRYFSLGEPLQTGFLAALRGEPIDADDLLRLRGFGLLAEATPGSQSRTFPPSAAESVIEGATSGRAHLAQLPEVAALVLASLLGVKVTPLAVLLARAARAAPIRTSRVSAMQLVADFLETRRLVPFPRVCLHDSLAMKAYLRRRGVASSLVFGVALNPFSAHCWLQIGSTVLNDTLDRAVRHTPILAV